MSRSAIQVVTERIMATYGSWNKNTTAQQMRDDWDALYAIDMSDYHCEDVLLNEVECRWVTDKTIFPSRTLIYIHGGGFRMGSVNSHQGLMGQLSLACNARVLGVDYRLMPEFAYPSQLADVDSVYQSLLEEGYDPSTIIVCGDSAGGNLVGALLNKLNAKQQPIPAAAIYLSAWLDMSLSASSYETCAAKDPIHQKKMLMALAKGYINGQADYNDPLVSPICGDLAGLPPSLLQVGDCEVGLGDSIDYAAKAKAAGVAVELDVCTDMIHVFQLFYNDLPEAKQAINNIGRFVSRHIPE